MYLWNCMWMKWVRKTKTLLTETYGGYDEVRKASLAP
jgi:hypothetical protein